MHVVTVWNMRVQESQQYVADRIEISNVPTMFSAPQGSTEVFIYNGMFGRKDAAIVIHTDQAIRIMPFWVERPEGY